MACSIDDLPDSLSPMIVFTPGLKRTSNSLKRLKFSSLSVLIVAIGLLFGGNGDSVLLSVFALALSFSLLKFPLHCGVLTRELFHRHVLSFVVREAEIEKVPENVMFSEGNPVIIPESSVTSVMTPLKR